MTEAFAASLTVRAVGWALVQSLWQGCLVAVVTALALLALRRSAASLRYGVACLGLFTLAAVPVATALLHGRELGTDARRQDVAVPEFVRADGRAVAAPGFMMGVERIMSVPAIGAAGRWPDRRFEEWSSVAVSLWLLGVLALSARLVAGWIVVERIRRAAARPASAVWRSCVRIMAGRLRITRPVRIVESTRVQGPMVVGWLRPVILVPASALAGLSPAYLEAVIAHELAHIRRHDYLVNLVQTTVETLVFYHPATWWISHRIRVEREHCCDDLAVELCGDRLTYARALVDLEQMRGAERLALAATGRSLLHRIRRLLGVSLANQDSSPTWALVSGTLAVLALLVLREGATSAQTAGDEGAIRGQVLDARLGVPLGGATVHVLDGDPVAAVSTDANGRYEAGGLKAGEYRIVVSAPGYVAAQHGQRRAEEDGTNIEVRAGQITSRVDVRLEPAGAISGRVFDDAGEGLAGVEIELLARRRYGAGGMVRAAVGFAQTDASGGFRVSDLEEGEYYLRAYVSVNARPSKGDGTEAYASTYFPQALRIDDAQPILVGGGQEIFDVNLALATAKKRVVSGVLVDPAGLPVDRARVLLATMRGGGAGGSAESAVASANGSFQIPNVVPGDYMLHVNDPVNPNRWPEIRRITVDDDVFVELSARRGARLEGRIVRDNGDPLPFDPAAIEVGFEQSVEGPPGTGGLVSMFGRKVVQRDGTFAIEGPGGSSSLRVSELPPNWSVKAIRLEGVDITDETADFGEGALRHVEIVLTDKIGSVVGRVTDRNNRVVLNHTVVIFPEDTRRWNARSRFVRSARPRQDGQFEIDDLPPTDYLAVAVETLPRNAWSDPAVLERLWPLATRFELREGERRDLTLKLASTPAGLLD